MKFGTKLLLGGCCTVAILSMASFPRKSERAGAQLLIGAQVPPQVRAVIERSCRDCHSEATHHPWYSYVAPVSWFIKHDVERGREHLNFSKWHEYSLIRRQRCLSEIANQIQDGGMPLAAYTFMHHSARLSQADVQMLFEWTQSERLRLITEASRGNP